MPIISMPMGLVLRVHHALPLVHVRGTADGGFQPDQPPTFFRPSSTSGRKPAMIRKNCSTSL